MNSNASWEANTLPERHEVDEVIIVSPTPTANLASMQNSFNGLNEFSNMLCTALSTMDANHNSLASSYATSIALLNNMRSQIAKQNETIKHLEKESSDQREKIETAVLSVTSLGKNVDSQLTESVKVMHKELVTTRTAAKMDMNQLRGKMTSSMSEAMSLIQDPKYHQKNAPQYDPNASTKESIDFLVEKIKVLEQNNELQHSVNTALSSSIAEGSGAMIQHIYDSLYEQITFLDTSLHASRAENDRLRNKYDSNFNDLQQFCQAQAKQIEDLTQAVVNKSKLKRFKIEVIRMKDETGSYVPAPTLTYKAEEPTTTDGASAATGAEAPAEGSEHHSRHHKRRSTSASRSSHSRRSSAQHKSDSDEEAENEDVAGDLPDHVPGTETILEKRRASQQAKRRHTSRKSHYPAGGAQSEHALDNVQYGGGQRGSVSSHHSHRSNRPTVVTSATPQETPVVGGAAPTEPHSPHKESTAAPASTRTTQIKSPAANRATIMATSAVAYKDPVTGKLSRPNSSSRSKSATDSHTIVEAEEEEEQEEEAAPKDTAGHHGAAGGEGGGGDEQEWDSDYSEYSDYSGGDSELDDDDDFESSEKVNKMMNDMKKDFEARIVDLETTIFGLKRMTYVMDDLKINYDNMKNKFDEVLSVKDDSVLRKLDAAKFAALEELKHKWHKVMLEMVFGLDNLADDQSAISEGDVGSSVQENRLFFKKAAELVAALEESMDDFEPRENINITLIKLHPGLDKIYKQALTLIKMDRVARHSDTLDFCFDDILCSDLTPNLKRFVEEAAAATVNVLDETIAKIGLQMRIDHLENLIETKADAQLTASATADVRHLLKSNVTQKEFSAVTGKLASLSDLATLRKQVMEMGPGVGGGVKGVNTTIDSSGQSVSTVEADVANNQDFKDMMQRFEMLTKQCGDLKEYCDKYVPREEVHEAMKAVIGEVKLIKKNYVPSNVFKEGLKLKADMEEVEKLVKALNEAIGELNLNNVLQAQKKLEQTNGPQAFGESAVIHQKCLICDKPVGSVQRAKTAGRNLRGSMELSKSATHLGYDKDSDALTKLPMSRPGSTLNRLTSANLEVSNSERAKVVTELAIVRSSIDPLPEITDSVTEGSPRVGSGANAANSQYKQRIRASAGGGVGPSYKMDTR